MSSYADHIELKYGNSQRWLVKFLREGYSDRYWKSHQPFISIYILDSIAGVLHGQTFKASRAGPVDPTFLLALKSRPANSRTRLVLTQCGQLGDTNGAYIDAIAEQFQLDPMFLCAHFQRCLYLTEGSDIGGATQLPVAAPSERNFISIRQGGSDSHMTATITASSKSNSSESYISTMSCMDNHSNDKFSRATWPGSPSPRKGNSHARLSLESFLS